MCRGAWLPLRQAQDDLRGNLVCTLVKCLVVLVTISLIFSCRKEHLQPADPSGNSEPLVYIAANLDGDSVYFAGGVNDYTGSTSVTDIGSNRTFSFTLKNPQFFSHSYFKISINNYSSVLGNPQSDLDNSIYPGDRSYDAGGLFFLPGSVTVYWVDAFGIEFKSTTAVPNAFSITSVEDVVFESKNYKKAMLQFECYLQYNFTDTIHLTHGNATVLFSVN